MNRIRTAASLLVMLGLGSSQVEAQFGLKKIKKAVDTATDVKDEVDRFTFTEEEEVELGLAISRRIIARYGVARDVDATRYLSLVGSAVAAKSDRTGLPWQWIILDSDAVNAFATPGGLVHVTRGALAVIESEAELGGVLAHEAAHVLEKHTLKGIQKSMGTELAQDRAEFSVGSDLFEAVADKAADAVLAGFGRAEELEADEVGIELAANVGYNADGLVRFLDTLDGLQEGAQTSSSLYRSHPETRDRIEALEKQMRKRDLSGGVWLAERYTDRIDYQVASTGTGAGAVEGARGVAGGDPTTGEAEESAASDEESETADKEEKTGFSLSQLSNPFEMGKQEQSAEVTGAGAGRAVGEEAGEEDSGPKELEPLTIEITQVELAAFLDEGGLE